MMSEFEAPDIAALGATQTTPSTLSLINGQEDPSVHADRDAAKTDITSSSITPPSLNATPATNLSSTPVRLIGTLHDSVFASEDSASKWTADTSPNSSFGIWSTDRTPPSTRSSRFSGSSPWSDRNLDLQGSYRDRRDNAYGRLSYNNFSGPRAFYNYRDHDRAPLAVETLDYDDGPASFQPEDGEVDHAYSVPSFGFQLPKVAVRTAESVQREKQEEWAHDIARRRIEDLIAEWVPRAGDFASMKYKIGLNILEVKAIERAIAEEMARLAKEREALLNSGDPLGLGLGERLTLENESKEQENFRNLQVTHDGDFGLMD